MAQLLTPLENAPPRASSGSSKYRGATVEDLDPGPALSTKPSDLVVSALMNAYERDYTHLTIVSEDTRALLGYLSIPRLRKLLEDGVVKQADAVGQIMQRFQRRRNLYKVITMDTPLEELEDFFIGGMPDIGAQEFAIVTDAGRRFVLGVVTKDDLAEFVKRRPAGDLLASATDSIT
ncbi:MAG: hypothetical protein M1826_000670 [Phylliscum demangeonii]|nr:MAG: hypothetical protein M1826_000670 [Phylliscum demangeonii]